MNKKVIVIPFLFTSVSLLSVSFFGLTYASWAVTDRANSIGVQIHLDDSTYTATFYTSYNEGTSSWGGANINSYVAGDPIEEPIVSLSGYIFRGWKSSAPTAQSYNSEFDSDDIEAIRISSNLTFYPVFESSAEYAYVNSDYYDLNTDVTFSVNEFGATLIGKKYVGISGIPNPTASWNDTRSVYSSSGIYQFRSENGAAMIYRKVGFKPNTTWLSDWNGVPTFGLYAWKTVGNETNECKVFLGSDLVNGKVYGYIPADYEDFKFIRNDHNKTEFDFTGANESANLSFDNSWYWNNDADNKYNSSTFVLQMNDEAGYSDWNSGSSTWIS